MHANTRKILTTENGKSDKNRRNFTWRSVVLGYNFCSKKIILSEAWTPKPLSAYSTSSVIIIIVVVVVVVVVFVVVIIVIVIY